MLWQHVVCLGCTALGVEFVAAILCGRRNWVAIPYFLIGLLFFCLPMVGPGTGRTAYRVAVAVDTFPVMITANVDPAELPREWDGETDKDKLLELEPLEGAEPLRFGNRAIVVVRKGGAAQVIKRKYMKLRTIFGDKPFKLGKDTYYPRFVS